MGAEPRRGSEWRTRLLSQEIIVAEADGRLLGFMSLAEGGDIDFAYIRAEARGAGLFPGTTTFARRSRGKLTRVERSSQLSGSNRVWHNPVMATNDDTVSAMGPVERASLSTLLENVERRISSIESKVATKAPEEKQWPKALVEVVKIVFAGWPVFGLVFLFLFYQPLSTAINAIPDKVKGAEEMSVLGVSLKTTIRKEAEKIGALQLSQTLPALTPAAVELLMRGERDRNYLMSYSPGPGPRDVESVSFPNEQLLTTLEELESKRLVTLIRDFDTEITIKQLREDIAAFKKLHPGSEARSYRRERSEWKFNEPREVDVPNPMWALTDLGKQAVEVIVNAVSTQLVPASDGRATGSK